MDYYNSVLCHFENWKVIRAYPFIDMVVVIKVRINLHPWLAVLITWKHVDTVGCLLVSVIITDYRVSVGVVGCQVYSIYSI